MAAVACGGAELVHVALQVVAPPIGALMPSTAPLTALLPPVLPPLFVVFEFSVVLLGAIDDFLRVERRAGRCGMLLTGVREGNHQHHDEVDQNPDARGKQCQQHKPDTHDRDVDVEVSREPGAHAAQHGAFAYLIQPLRRGAGAAARFGLRVRFGPRRRAGRRRAFALNRSHLLENIVDFGGGQDILVRSQVVRALVGDRLLEIGHDFDPVGIVLELCLRALEIGSQALKARFFEMKRISIEIDDDDCVHAQRPSWLIVVLR